MKLFKFRSLSEDRDINRIKDIIDNGFYCNNILNFNDMNEGIFRTEDFPDIELDDKEKYKICSFSGINALNSELMWGHYANAGKGVVIEIDVGQGIGSVSAIIDDIYQVRYSNRATTNTDRVHEDEVIDILTRKSMVWQYEDEFRYIKKTETTKVKIGKISKIWFGTPYKNLSNYEEFQEKSEKLRSYLNLKSQLEEYCRERDIETMDFDFDF